MNGANKITVSVSMNNPPSGVFNSPAVYRLAEGGELRLVNAGTQYLDGISPLLPRAIDLAAHHRKLGLTPHDVRIDGYRFNFSA